MSQEKVQWTQPQLIVLARGMPEESILQACKYIDALSPPPGPGQGAQQGCSYPDQGCAACQSRGSQT